MEKPRVNEKIKYCPNCKSEMVVHEEPFTVPICECKECSSCWEIYETGISEADRKMISGVKTLEVKM